MQWKERTKRDIQHHQREKQNRTSESQVNKKASSTTAAAYKWQILEKVLSMLCMCVCAFFAGGIHLALNWIWYFVSSDNFGQIARWDLTNGKVLYAIYCFNIIFNCFPFWSLLTANCQFTIWKINLPSIVALSSESIELKHCHCFPLVCVCQH